MPAAFRGFVGRIPPNLIEGSVDSAEEFRNKIATADTYPTIDWRNAHLYEKLFSPEAYAANYKRLVTDSLFHEFKVDESPFHLQPFDDVLPRAAFQSLARA
jgi:hypothetical protein